MSLIPTSPFTRSPSDAASVRQILVLTVGVISTVAAPLPVRAQPALPAGGRPVLAADALLTTPVGGLERTRAEARVVPVMGASFSRALRLTTRADAPESNATQLTIPTAAPVAKGDVLLASFSLRGAGEGNRPAQVMLLFERRVDPWTKSVDQAVTGDKDPKAWKRVVIPFTAAESYRPGEAMASLRFAFGRQTVEVGGLTVVNYDGRKSLSELTALAAEANPLGRARVTVRLSDPRQTLLGLGGNFAQARYGSGEMLDPVGRYNLQHLHVAHARIGVPLNAWTPEKGVYKDEGPARAAFLLLREMARRKIPVTGSVWEGPGWMLGGRPEQSGRTLPPERYDDCIEAVARFLVTARDKYGAKVDTFSFNEPDYGVNFRFTPAQMAAFIRRAGPRFRALGLKTKFLVGDTGGGSSFPEYARPLLEDKGIALFLGPLAFHSWDALTTPDARYAEIAALGRKYGKPVWCLETGHDSGLWQKPDPWETWENALRTAMAYLKALNLTGAALMDYWTYQDNYPLVSRDGARPFPVFHVLRQVEAALPPGAKVVRTAADNDGLYALATAGPARGRFTVLLATPSGGGSVTVAGLPPGARVTVVRSTAAGQRKKDSAGGRVDRAGRLTVSVPSRSVVTLLSSSPSRSKAE